MKLCSSFRPTSWIYVIIRRSTRDYINIHRWWFIPRERRVVNRWPRTGRVGARENCAQKGVKRARQWFAPSAWFPDYHRGHGGSSFLKNYRGNAEFRKRLIEIPAQDSARGWNCRSLESSQLYLWSFLVLLFGSLNARCLKGDGLLSAMIDTVKYFFSKRCHFLSDYLSANVRRILIQSWIDRRLLTIVKRLFRRLRAFTSHFLQI